MASNTTPPPPPSSNSSAMEEENLFAIIALVSLFVIFSIYCCWGSSCCKKFLNSIKTCRKGRSDRTANGGDEGHATSASSPTIILLPYGRILVVDGTVFARFRINTGLDLFELGDRVLRSERNAMHRTPSFVELDMEDDSKNAVASSAQRLSPLPPTYESIFGDSQMSTPPPYLDALRTAAATGTGGVANMENSV